MKKILCMILSVVMLTAALSGCAKKPVWDNITKDTVVATVEGEEFKYDLLRYFYYEKSVSTEITKDLESGIENFAIEVDDNTENFTQDDALNRLICLAALSAVADKEGKALSRDEAYAYTVDTLTGKIDQYPYMQTYLDMMCKKLDVTQDELLSIASDELRILMNSDEIAKEELVAAMTETGSRDAEILVKEVAGRLAEKAKTVSIVNNMTGQEKYMPEFDDYAKEIVYLYMNN